MLTSTQLASTRGATVPHNRNLFSARWRGDAMQNHFKINMFRVTKSNAYLKAGWVVAGWRMM